MSFFPEDLGGPVGAMTALVGLMVIIGMTMDALGAVVLVSVTLAKVAYDNGIDPTHFWMMVLVAFELGYLTPPVALNHLLAKQVIGAEAHLEDEGLGFGRILNIYGFLCWSWVLPCSSLLMYLFMVLKISDCTM